MGARTPRRAALREAGAVLLLSRALAWASAVLSAVVLGARNDYNAGLYDQPRFTAPRGLGHDALTPLAHWDSVWYLAIADHGYGAAAAGPGPVRAAFFPLYPLLVRFASGLAASPALELLAAFAVSIAAFGGALYLLHRLAALELGGDNALATILLLALFPGALFFAIPYAESVFLLVSVGAVYAARRGRWAWAGLLAAAASATRSAGLTLLVPLALLYLYGPREDRAPDGPESRRSRFSPRYRLRPNLLWLALAPVGIAAYSAYLGVRYGDAFAWGHVEKVWSRSFAGPFFALADGASAAWHGVRQLVAGSERAVYLARGQLDATRGAIEDVALFGLAIAALVATVGTFRRLPLAYGAYVVAALSLPLSFPASGQPLESLLRFVAVLFPLFMWLAVWTRERNMTDVVTIAFGGLLALCASQYAAWEFVG